MINWLTLSSPENGESTITLYELNQDQGTNGTTWDNTPVYVPNQVTELKQLNFTLSDILSGKDYQFRVRAGNEFGWGEFSEAITIRAAGVPHKMEMPMVVIDQDGDVAVSWVAPVDGGEPITGYRIEFTSPDV